jgi:hypothetical protein
MNPLALALPLLLLAFAAPAGDYPIVGTGQAKCYDNQREIPPPSPGEAFYGQDAQRPGPAPSYTLGEDGLTVRDNVTGLTWQRSPVLDGSAPRSRDKLTLAQALALPARLNAARFAVSTDWRLPTVKELYSLILFSGVDAGPNAEASSMVPFLDTRFFRFAYGDPDAGERTIDSQWATRSTYAANPNQMFGVNFADGRIKGYGAKMPTGKEKTFYALCVRGNPNYGKNDFADNGDGTVTDRATGLTWTKADSGKGMNWKQALAWAQQKNAENHLGRSDWRLPNAKELQSLVDYTRSPKTSNSAAIDPVFQCSKLADGEYPFYWTSTTHVGGPRDMQGGAAVYVAFGRATGWMPPGGRGGGQGMGGPPSTGGPPGMGGALDGPHGFPPPGGPPPGGPMGGGGGSSAGGSYQLMDVHGAGAQRSDPKDGDPSRYPHGRGPQGDVVRILNHVRLVRG